MKVFNNVPFFLSGLKFRIDYSGGVLIYDVAWVNVNPHKYETNIVLGQLGGAGFHFVWEKNKTSNVINGEVISMPTVVNVGATKYAGFSFADDLSMFSINVGLSWPPIPSINLPIEFDVSLGSILYDWLHSSQSNGENRCQLQSSDSRSHQIIYNPDFLKAL